MSNLTTVVIVAVIFALVGTMVFAAVAPNVMVVKANPGKLHDPCGPNKDPPCGNKKR